MADPAKASAKASATPATPPARPSLAEEAAEWAPLLLAFAWRAAQCWAVTLLASLAFLERPDPDSPPQLAVERGTFVAAMGAVGTAASAWAFARAVAKPGASVGAVRFAAMPVATVFLVTQLALDLVVVVPMSGVSLERYVADAGARYLGKTITLAFVVDGVAGAATRARDPSEEKSNVLCFLMLLARSPLTWAAPYSVSFYFFAAPDEDAKKAGRFSGHMLVTEELFESSMFIARSLAFAYFANKVFDDVGPRRIARWAPYVALVFWAANLALDVAVTAYVRVDKPQPLRYVAQIALGNLALVPLAWLANTVAKHAQRFPEPASRRRRRDVDD